MNSGNSIILLRRGFWPIASSVIPSYPHQYSQNGHRHPLYSLKNSSPQRCKGSPKILTHTSQFFLSSERQPKEGFHQSKRIHLPLKHLTPECSTRSTSAPSSNSKSINDPPNKAKQKCPLNIQLDCAQDLRESREGG